MHFTIFKTPILAPLLHWVCLLILKLLGWKIIGEKPTIKKYVFIAAPHTSNWDAFYMIVFAFAFQLDMYWMGKDKLFKGRFGFLLKWLGGLSIDRSKANNVVSQSIEIFNKSESLILAVPPEGTRGKVKKWKTGFYHIAHGAGVPIALSFLDYGTKSAGFFPSYTPTGHIEKDMKEIQGFYADIKGKYHHLTTLDDESH